MMRSIPGLERCLLVTAALLLLAATAGAELAVFVDGRVLKVEDAYLEGEKIVLVLPGSAHIKVSALRIDRVVADEVEVVPVTQPTDVECVATWSDVELPASTPFRDLISEAAEEADLHPELLAAVVRAESAFDPWAISRAGAAGLTQLMPAAAHDQGVIDVFDPEQNLRGGARHLRELVDRFESLSHALAAYNAGATTVIRYGGVPPYRETINYVTKITRWFCTDNSEPKMSDSGG